jgi:cysteine desulfurase / selenocysteine lyase
MSTSEDLFTQDLNTPGGLSGAAELAALAADYFPEFAKCAVEKCHAAAAEVPQPVCFERIVAEAIAEAEASEPCAEVQEFETVAAQNPYDEFTTPGFLEYVRPLEPYDGFDVHAIRRDFPILSEQVNGRDLIWLDNAATTQKPQSVIDRLAYFYTHENSNVHRGEHTLAARATDAYEAARGKVAAFINAPSAKDIVFVRGTTEGINLVAQGFARHCLQEGDEIVISQLEHHANIVPWQFVCEETGAKLRVIPVDDCGQVLPEEAVKLLGPRTKLVSVAQVSNALGTVTPVEDIIALAHKCGAKVLVDGAQGISHRKVDVQALDADFYVFSGHKIYGPTGIGALYAKPELLAAMHPYQGGGNMISDVTFERSLFQEPPQKFEAGTGNIADAVGLGAALDYVSKVGLQNIARYEQHLLQYTTEALARIPGVMLVGTAKDKASIQSFIMDGYTTAEVGRALDREGIAVRSGHHCAQPVLRRFGLESTVRPSFAFYNTCGEVDVMAAVLRKLADNRSAW